jgi:zinc protease
VFGNWPSTRMAVPPVPPELFTAAPGLYLVNKDVNQGRVSIGLPVVKRDHPDIYALEVMNEILGGSGFTARITKTVRSNEGLAYSAGSGLSFGVYSPGPFRAAFQSKSRTVAYAAQLVFGEIEKLRETPVTEDELKTIKDNLVATFPSQFASKAQTAAIFASDEYTKRDPAFWQTYRDRIAAVTAADVQRVAREHLVPGKMLVLVVGDQKEIAIGDGKHDAKLSALVAGKVTELPLRDPMTMRR